MTPQELKNSILQLAIQGKLVEQRADEGTGAELLEKSLAAKNAKDAKGKGEKSHAKSAKSAKVGSCVSREEIPDDEKPFEIPESWEWVRLGEVVSNRAGLAYSKGNLIVKKGKMIRVLRGGNIADMGYCTKPDDVLISDEFVNSELFLRRNMLITPAVTSLDHVGKMARIEDDYDDMVVGGFVLMLTPYINDDIFSRYFLCACSSKYFRDCCRNIVNKSGQAFYNLSRTKMMELIFPLPPLAEQKRIVAKIEELLPLVDRYEKAWSRLEDFHKRFPVDMQKSLLQMAIQGKLVEQRADEGTGAELLEKIFAAKNAEGAKGKGEKSHAKSAKSAKIGSCVSRDKIPDDEKPFDIPESWEWARLGVVVDVRDGTHDTPKYVQAGVPLVTSKNLVSGTIDFTNAKFISYEDSKAINIRSGVDDGDVLFAMIGTIGNPVLIRKDREFSIKNMALFKPIDRGLFCMEYLMMFLTKAQFDMRKSASASVQSFVSLSFLRNYPIPLPPLAEQKRIVAKLEELLPLCERLKSESNSAANS